MTDPLIEAWRKLTAALLTGAMAADDVDAALESMRSAIIRAGSAIEEAEMGTRYECEQREQREDERRQAELDADRRADHAPAERVLRTPREEVDAYVKSAAECLLSDPQLSRGGGRWSVARALWRLDRAREVLRSPNVVDGAALLRGTVQEALDAAEEGDSAAVIGRLEEAVELLDRQVRYPDVEIPVHSRDFADPDAAGKRNAMRAAIARYQFELESAGSSDVSDETLDGLIHAIESPF